MAASAAWAMFRPSRKRIEVASLSLWREAAAAVPPAARRARRFSWNWLLLLTGATAGVFALAGPVVRPEAAARHVAIAVRLSAELGRADGLGELRQAVETLLDRLDGDDRVQLLLPAAAGGGGEWLSPAQTRAKLRHLAVLPTPADLLDLPAPAPDAQHTWIFSPARADDAVGPNVTVVALPAHLPPVTIDAVAAEPDGQRGVRLFVAFRNQTDRPQNVTARLDDGSSSPAAGATLAPRLLPPGGRGSVSALIAGRETIRVSIGAGVAVGEEARLVRRDRPRAKVAMTGPDEPLLRKFVAVCPGLELTGTPGEADLIFANAPASGDLPAGKPALVVDPQGAGGATNGWVRADAAATVVSPAVVSGQDPVMRDVSLAGLALRRVRPWVRLGEALGVELARAQGGALVLRTDPAASGEADQPRRIYLAFDLSAENAHFDRPEMLPILLANATDWLLGARPPTAAYETPSPNLTGLLARPVTASPVDVVAGAPLPDPLPSRRDVPLWPVLAMAAMMLWLSGWTARGA